jgi:integrase/recombinase XerC
VEEHKTAPGMAGLHVVAGLALLWPEEQVFAAMLDGWGSQQAARNLAPGTVAGRQRAVRAFAAMPRRTRGPGRRRWSTSGAPTCAPCGGCAARRCAATSWPSGCSAPTSPIQPTTGHSSASAALAPTHPGRPRVERRRARPAGRSRPVQAGVHPGGAASLLRPRRRPGRPHPWRRPQGLAARLPGRGAVQGRLRLRAAPQRDAHAGRGRLRPQPPRTRVRRVWRVLCAPRQGHHRFGAQAPQRADGVVVGAGGLGGVDLAVPAAAGPTSQPGAVAVGAGRAHWAAAAQQPVCRLPRRARAAGRAGLPLAAPLVCHHLVEDGWDARFVQEQAGHQHASTTSIYTCVSSDFRTRTLRRVLDQTVQAALARRPT